MANNFRFFLISITFLTFVSFLSSSCTQSKIIDEEKFIQIYTDILLAEDDTIAGTAISNEAILKRILNKYMVSFEEYRETIHYYNQDSERWEMFFTKAIANLEKQKMSSAD